MNFRGVKLRRVYLLARKIINRKPSAQLAWRNHNPGYIHISPTMSVHWGSAGKENHTPAHWPHFVFTSTSLQWAFTFIHPAVLAQCPGEFNLKYTLHLSPQTSRLGDNLPSYFTERIQATTRDVHPPVTSL